jgi:hypothetical protein
VNPGVFYVHAETLQLDWQLRVGYIAFVPVPRFVTSFIFRAALLD